MNLNSELTESKFLTLDYFVRYFNVISSVKNLTLYQDQETLPSQNESSISNYPRSSSVIDVV